MTPEALVPTPRTESNLRGYADGEVPSPIAEFSRTLEREIGRLSQENEMLAHNLALNDNGLEREIAELQRQLAEAQKLLSEQDFEYNRKTNALIARHAEQLAQAQRELAKFGPINGNRDDTSLANWFPLSAKELTSLRTEFSLVIEDADKLRDAYLVAEKKGDAEMERVKACEHIALGDQGWEVLRNLCPSTAAVAALREQLAERDAENEVLREQNFAMNKTIADERPAVAGKEAE